MIRSLLVALAVVLLLPAVAQAQTVDEIIAKNAQARGGLEKLKAVKTMRMTATVSAGSFRAQFVRDNKRDDKVREETILQGLARVRAYDGKTAWQVNPFRGRKDPELISEDNAKSLIVHADIEGPLIDYKVKGHNAELLGHDSVEGTDCYKIKLTLKDGDVRYYYLDADSFLEIKIESESKIRGALQYTDTFLGDYDQVNGIYFPFAIETGETGSEKREKFTVDKIVLNLLLDDAMFTMPVLKTDANPSPGVK
jgi:outer membrane lipoprotein-sorting protein